MKRIKLEKLDLLLFSASLGLVILGLLFLFHVQSLDQTGPPEIFWRQLVYAVIGMSLMIGAAVLSPRVHFALAYVIYAGSAVVLLGILLWGSVAKGAVRWVDLGLFTFQPSEPAKIGLILALARLVTDKKFDLRRPGHLLQAAAITSFPLMLVMAQPDLGTSIVFGAIFLSMMIVAGAPLSYLLILFSPVLAAITSFHAIAFLLFMALLLFMTWRMKLPLTITILLVMGNLLLSAATPLAWNQLKPYQQKRLITFINPEADPKGAGYQVIQSKVAVGSGGLLGKGLGQGSQTQLKFLPEQHTDFIFSVVGEETGLLGGTVVLILYAILISRCFAIAALCSGKYARLVCVGLSSLLATHIFINIGMAIGLLPVTGLPLPFLSYGGSFLWTCMVSGGIILGIQFRKGDYTP
ncbi:MAG TPA: rod shape-determining protein RodA [bacterium]